MDFRTSAVRGGVRQDKTFNAVIAPIYPSTTFTFDKIGVNKGYDYTRSANPTRKALEDTIAALEGGALAYCTGTGMAACSVALLLLKPGDHVITGHDIYGGTYRLMLSVFTKWGLEFSYVDMGDPDNVRRALKPNTKMVWIETPSNPLLNIVDVAAVAAIGKAAGATVVVDNTFLSPYFQRPFELGADIVVHSTTKYINGHSDVCGGAVVVKDAALGPELFFLINTIGLGESPFDSWLMLRGVKTLAPRMEAHAANALAIARFLSTHPKVVKTYYPGLESHPGHALAKRQQKGFGGMVAFDLDLKQLDLDTFAARLQLWCLAESLGGVESLVEMPWYMSHASIPEDLRRLAKISEGTVRLSVGIEAATDLIADLRQALG